MPYEIETKDGIVVRNIPDNIPPDHESLRQRVMQARGQRDVAAVNPTEGNDFFQNMAIGAGKAVYDAGRGAGQMLRSVVPESTANTLGLPTEADVAESRKRDAPLMNTAGGMVGNIGGNVAMTAALPGAGTYTGAVATGAALGALQPTVEGESRGVNTAIGGVAGGAGKYAGDKVMGAVTSRFADETARQVALRSQNASRDATLAAGREAGLVVPPATANPQSAWNSLLEGISGKIKTGQVASQKNREGLDRLSKEAIGLPADAPITKEALALVRKDAGQAYADIANFGTYATDSTFRSQLLKLSDAQQVLAKEVPELANKEVLALVESLNKPSFEGTSVIAVSKALREKATAAFKAGETDAGRFYRGASDAVEDLVERNLMSTNQTGLLEAFRAARQTIAKSYTIEAALNEATGSVVGSKLAAQLKNGKLSGGLKTAAEFSKAFPKATQEIRDSIPATSPLDWYASVGASAASGSPLPMALAAARPTIRSMLLSDPYQAAMTQPSYNVGSLLRAGNASEPVVKRIAPGAATIGGLGYFQQ